MKEYKNNIVFPPACIMAKEEIMKINMINLFLTSCKILLEFKCDNKMKKNVKITAIFLWLLLLMNLAFVTYYLQHPKMHI